jgi:surface polysaccharide O-acyltransferase-like enzyme
MTTWFEPALVMSWLELNEKFYQANGLYFRVSKRKWPALHWVCQELFNIHTRFNLKGCWKSHGN